MNQNYLKSINQPIAIINGVPIILAIEKNGISKWYCKHCKQFHKHGGESGNRTSHCVKEDSPFYQKNYYLLILNYKTITI